MTKIKRLVAVVLSLLMIFASVSSVASAAAWDATTSDGFALDVTTKIFRQVDGEWIETDKVKAGETVKARVYLNTDFFTNGGDLVFFYNADFFSDSYSADKNALAVNTAFYTGEAYGIKGEFLNSKKEIPTLYGNVKLSIEAGANTGDKHRLKGKGVENVSTKRKGDMYVIFKVYTPKRLTREQKSLIEKLSKTSLNTSEIEDFEEFVDKND